MGSGEGSTMRNFILCTVRLSQAIKSRRLRLASHVARMEEGRSPFNRLTRKHTAKRPLGRPRSRCEDTIKMDLK